MVKLLFDNDSSYDPTEELIEIIKMVIDKSLETEKLKHNFELSLVFTTDNIIKEMNKKYRKIDKATDVLSFPLLSVDEIDLLKTNLTDNDIALGDIVISIDKAQAQAKEYNHSFERELSFLVCHSIFHLLGYDHLNLEEEKIMKNKQNAVLLELEITR